jgi:hypothetical protein
MISVLENIEKNEVFNKKVGFRTAYLSTLIDNNLTKIEHFDKNDISELQNVIIENPLPTKLNKLQKSNIEAFYYWWKVFEIEKNNKKGGG